MYPIPTGHSFRAGHVVTELEWHRSHSDLGIARPPFENRVSRCGRTVADNPGDWVFHCHVIEHQKTGLAGLIRVA